MNETKTEAPMKVSQNAAAIKKMGEEVEMKVIDSINVLVEGGLVLPAGYKPANAIKYAWLKLQGTEDKGGQNVLDTCTKASIANAMLAMVLKGETMLYNHGYFIAYGDKLTYFEDYRGKLMRAMRDTDIQDVNAQVIYENDNFVYTVDKTGKYQFVSHETSLDNIDISKIKGGYAIVTYKDGTSRMEVMTIAQIRASWAQGAAKGNSMAHAKFTDQMAIRTLINRAIKIDLGKCSETVTGIEDDDQEELDTAAEHKRDELQKQVEDFKELKEDEFQEVNDEVVREEEPKTASKKRECPI